MDPAPTTLGWRAPDFSLRGVAGPDPVTLSDQGDGVATLVMFICNHCPYVLSALDRIKTVAEDLKALGIRVIAINSNDAATYPADSFDNMKLLAAREDLPFVYLHDADQSVARAWGAVCTPEFFGLDGELRVKYRGRLDSAGGRPAGADTRREVFEAMKQIAETGEGPDKQIPSMGCSIKWKDGRP